MRAAGPWVAAAACLLLAAPAAHAQNGRVVGVVRDAETDAPIEGAKVEIKSTTMGTSQRGKSNAEGQYRIVNVRFGEYDVVVEREGYVRYTAVFTIEPKSSEAATFNVKMKPLPKKVARRPGEV